MPHHAQESLSDPLIFPIILTFFYVCLKVPYSHNPGQLFSIFCNSTFFTWALGQIILSGIFWKAWKLICSRFSRSVFHIQIQQSVCSSSMSWTRMWLSCKTLASHQAQASLRDLQHPRVTGAQGGSVFLTLRPYQEGDAGIHYIPWVSRVCADRAS